MLTRSLTKHATGNIIKISLMMNFQAPVTCPARSRGARPPPGARDPYNLVADFVAESQRRTAPNALRLQQKCVTT
jgi:hypothetical protein